MGLSFIYYVFPFYGISVYLNVCLSIYMYFLCFSFDSFFSVCLLFSYADLLVLYYINYYYLEVCLFSNEKKKERVLICLGADWRGPGRTWGGKP